jgi:tRNA acetyltransferase TAN1
MKFNLIVTTFRNRENDAIVELSNLISFLGDKEFIIETTTASGVILCYSKIDPFVIVARSKSLVIAEPWQFRYILRIIPLEKNCLSNLYEFKKTIDSLRTKISPSDTYKIQIVKRFCHLRTSDIISNLARGVSNNVNLSSPDWIILIEIIGKWSGISIMKPDQIFSAVKEKRDFS